ncbi:MAG: 4Fe-4S binding protein [Candidatus Omnitrophica bacterium]|nr:4Fe-4S binding protein [Candidatus Omnitrophota bacterium]
MSEYLLAEKQRKKRQLVVAFLFIAVLTLGWFWPLVGLAVPGCFFLAVGIGIFKGRKWCDWFCPRGSFFDALVKPLSPRTGIPGLFRKRSFQYTVLFVSCLIVLSNLISRWPDLRSIGRFFLVFLGMTTGIGVILGLVFQERSWCSFCPAGFLAGLTGKNKGQTKIVPRLCSGCRICDRVCPMQISPSELKKPQATSFRTSDCIQCRLCIMACPTKALGK